MRKSINISIYLYISIYACVATLVGALGGGVAHAQMTEVGTQPEFSVERLMPAPGPGTFLSVEDGDVAGHLKPTFGLVTSVSSRPLVVRHTLDDRELSEPVALRSGADLLAALGILGRYQIGLATPLVLYQSGDRLQELDLPDEGADDPLAATTFGDIRVHAKVRILEPRFGYGFAAAGAVIVTLPTGDDEQFAGEAGTVLEGRIIGSWRNRRFAAAANLGARIRTKEVEFLAPTLRFGNELTYGIAGSSEIPFVTGWIALLELAGASDLEGGPSPAEARLGVRHRIGVWTVGAGGGVGIGNADAIGAPGWRAFLEVRHEPSPRADADHDGIPNAEDQCPLEHEDVDGTQDRDGCIDPDDDGDGILDVDDDCADDPEDKDRWGDSDGCPEFDNDDDGILDAVDKCPNDAEDDDNFSDDDGCPDGDNDSDGIPDAEDRCKDEQEDKDGNRDDDGCPDLDDDEDGVPDVSDRCPAEVEDPDGFRDEDGCLDSDDDRDGVPDGVDQCLDQPETITSSKDVESDGCPDGAPIAKPAPDGTIWLSPAAKKLLVFPKGKASLSADGMIVLRAVARAAHRASWNEARGADGALVDAVLVTAAGDGPEWDDLARIRSEAVAAILQAEGVRARVESGKAGPAGSIKIVATPEGLSVGPTIPLRTSK